MTAERRIEIVKGFDRSRWSYRLARRLSATKIIEEKMRLGIEQGLLSPEDIVKIQHASEIWGYHMVISNAGFLAQIITGARAGIFDASPEAFGHALWVPGALRVLSTLAHEIKYPESRWFSFFTGHFISLSPGTFGGSAMPAEIFKTLGISYISYLTEQSRNRVDLLAFKLSPITRGIPL